MTLNINNTGIIYLTVVVTSIVKATENNACNLVQ